MFDKLFQAQQKAQEVKSRLDSISVVGEAEGGKVRVIATANKEVKEIAISDELFAEGDKEQLEELLLVALNKAFAQADNVSQTEMQAVSQDMFGSLGNLFNK
jgi:DNA-binding protein YbaB